tara:strand:+ start:1454 stop:1672 length:219 start_codon:yes stop_codon:yes gene_type:complete
MDFWTLLDTWWFRIITLPIDFIIFYYVGKWIAKRAPLWYDEKKLEDAEKYEKKIINWFKGLFIKEKKRGPFL